MAPATSDDTGSAVGGTAGVRGVSGAAAFSAAAAASAVPSPPGVTAVDGTAIGPSGVGAGPRVPRASAPRASHRHSWRILPRRRLGGSSRRLGDRARDEGRHRVGGRIGRGGGFGDG